MSRAAGVSSTTAAFSTSTDESGNRRFARRYSGTVKCGACSLRLQSSYRDACNARVHAPLWKPEATGDGSRSASNASASSSRPMRIRRRISRYLACAAFTKSPCASRVSRAAASLCTGQPSSRSTSAISASATTHLARETGSLRAECARGASHERFRSDEIAELRHRDSSKRKRGCIVTQRDPFECAKRVAGGKCPTRGRD